MLRLRSPRVSNTAEASCLSLDDWREVAHIVLHRDPVAEPVRTERCWRSHLDRARWFTEVGYRLFLR